jgi:hypothetical protein
LATVHSDLTEEVEVWRLVTEKIATLTELETVWSYDDMIRANVTLGVKSEIDQIYGEVSP